MVAEIHTAGITPTQMLARMLRIEYLLERTDKSLKKPRTIDLDLLFYSGEHVDTPFLTVPHRQPLRSVNMTMVFFFFFFCIVHIAFTHTYC